MVCFLKKIWLFSDFWSQISQHVESAASYATVDSNLMMRNQMKTPDYIRNHREVSEKERDFRRVFWWSRLGVMVLSMGPSPPIIVGSCWSAVSLLQSPTTPRPSSGVRLCCCLWELQYESSAVRLLTEAALSPLSLYGPLLPPSLPFFVSPTTALFGGSVFLLNLGTILCILDKTANVFLSFWNGGIVEVEDGAVGIYRHCNCKSVQKLGHLH